MSNPILEMVRRQNEISDMLRNPSRMYDEMIQNNPAFKKFVEENQGKSIEQIANEHGISMDDLNRYIR